jgi:predicted dehydrogenase
MNISDQTRNRLESQLGFALPPYRLDYENFRTDYRLGVIGLHWVMQIMQLPAYKAARYNISCAAEINPEAIRTALEKRLVPDDITDDWRELVAREDVDIVDSCFGHKPDRQHKKLELVQAAVEAGKPVLVHKPAASTLGIAEQMLQAAENSGVPVCVNQNCRYNPAAYSVNQLLAPERLGRPLIVEIQQYWRGDPKPADDRRPAWMQHYIHHADLLRWWVGSPCVSVYSKAQQVCTMTIYEFESGAVVYHIENHTGVRRNDNSFRLQTENGVIMGKHNWDWHLGNAEGRDVVHVYRNTSEPPASLPLPMLPYEPVWSDINKWLPHEGPWYDLSAPTAGMMGCIGSIMKGLSENTEPDNHIRSGVEALRMALAAEISAATGKPVNPADVPSDYTTVTEPPA